MVGIGVNTHEGVVTRKVRQPFKQLVPDASGIGLGGTGAPPTNATWIYLDDAEIPVGWAGREPPKVPNVGDHLELGVSPVTGTLLRTKFRNPARRRQPGVARNRGLTQRGFEVAHLDQVRPADSDCALCGGKCDKPPDGLCALLRG